MRTALPHGAQQALVALHGTGASAGGVGERVHVVNDAMGQGSIFSHDRRYSAGSSSAAQEGKKNVRRREAVSRYARVRLARCAFSRSQTKHPLAFSSRSSAFRNAMPRLLSISLPG